MVAGLLKAPSRYAPTNDLDEFRDRAATVLDRMVDAGFITQEQAIAARTRPAKLAPDSQTALAGHFVDWALDGLKQEFGKSEHDLTVKTTIDPVLQKAAEAAVAKVHRRQGRGARRLARPRSSCMDTGGAIRALVGGRAYRQSSLDRATDARRQPGSAFKPFVYLAAIQDGLSPDQVYADEPVKIGDWEPHNYSGKYVGNVTCRRRLRPVDQHGGRPGRRAVGPAQGDRDRAPPRHHLAARARALAGARHLRGHAARAHRRLPAVRRRRRAPPPLRRRRGRRQPRPRPLPPPSRATRRVHRPAQPPAPCSSS